jgi:hypothetical protein
VAKCFDPTATLFAGEQRELDELPAMHVNVGDGSANLVMAPSDIVCDFLDVRFNDRGIGIAKASEERWHNDWIRASQNATDLPTSRISLRIQRLPRFE